MGEINEVRCKGSVPMRHNQGSGRAETSRLALRKTTEIVSVVRKEGASGEWLEQRKMSS